ncbi:hypothetical protein phiCbK_028 [Caulobacter phage phiCbK]|uniref:Uncharacterized protein n=5 Tax=Viruses TaxID=10239 RepID=J3SKV2_9CAUD|nr:hypothetical protein D865_gp125 [Caulobacter phage phiCbK]AFO71542.1 hypothetical protein phiCbK_028 [Caulobacter phage phiCbK]AFU87125.1 hypothetical protein CbK_gp293 [Caulobacter phage phiCbK]ARB15206.1 hypothetical protein Ccr32_gp288 [Caulobacter phage Ccr32]ARB15540.1 hypothetical protein Ccr34_gp298 [Caulobacter phage Ccr34]
MPRPAHRRHALYLLVVSCGPLVIMKGPEAFTPWPVLRKAILKTMREAHGLKASEVSAVEGLADPRSEDPQDRNAVEKFAAAFAGSDNFPAFHLYAWTGEGFALVRAPLEQETAA